MIVEREMTYPCFIWAKDINVRIDAQVLDVSGVKPIWPEDLGTAPDLFRSYRRDVSRFRNGQPIKGRHWQFANAKSRHEQIQFVKQFGPVVVSSSKTENREGPPTGPFNIPTFESVVLARQNLAELEGEQRLYRSAFVLLAELRKGKQANLQTVRDTASAIADDAGAWPAQWERERKLRATGEGYLQKPDWFFGRENVEHLQALKWYMLREPSGDSLRDLVVGIAPLHAAHLILCEVINAFQLRVNLWGDTPVESPEIDLTGGIRPILYFILRREYLRAGGVGICRNTDCRAVFEIERSGQQFCSDVCSRQQRQREYWMNKGKKLRARRLKSGRKRK